MTKFLNHSLAVEVLQHTPTHTMTPIDAASFENHQQEVEISDQATVLNILLYTRIQSEEPPTL